jgi:hypothetical protein
MSRTVVYDPVCTGGTSQVAKPPVVKIVTMVFDPKCAILSGTQTAVTEVV